MKTEMFEIGDLVHVAQGAKRFCTVVEVSTTEPKYRVQFGTDAQSIQQFKSFELALVQKYSPREDCRRAS